MAAGDRYVGCSNPEIGVLELLNAITAQVTATGVHAVRQYVTTTAGENLSPSIPCNGTLHDLEVWLRNVIVLDNNGDPAIHFVNAT